MEFKDETLYLAAHDFADVLEYRARIMNEDFDSTLIRTSDFRNALPACTLTPMVRTIESIPTQNICRWAHWRDEPASR